MAQPWSPGPAGTTDGSFDADHDTIALLQEEIARLEDELRMRDDAAAAERLAARPAPGPGVPDQVAAEAMRRSDSQAAELADREETIALLLEHLRLAEEAEAASRAEWEQLNVWVQEVERRVAERGDAGG